MTFENYLNLGQILVSIVLIFVILLQAKGSGFGAGLGGTTSVLPHPARPGEDAVPGDNRPDGPLPRHVRLERRGHRESGRALRFRQNL